LHTACRHEKAQTVQQSDYERIAKMLLDAGAKVDSRNAFGSTPLGLATYVGDAKLTTLLLERGADPDARDNNNRTPFTTACRYGHEAVVKVLLDHGAETGDMLGAVETATGSAGMAGAQAKGATQSKPQPVSTDLVVDFMESAIRGDADKLEKLINAGVDVNVATKGGDTALILAAGLGYARVASVLLDHGADIDQGTASARATPLMWAAFNGKTDLVRLLVERGADIAKQNNKAYTALMLAAEEGRDEILRFLHAEGADVNAVNAEGHSPLTLASVGGHAQVVEYLIAQGADVQIRTREDGSTALILAAEKGYEDVARLLVGAGVKVNARRTKGLQDSALTLACREGDTAMVNLLLDHGADVNASNRRGPAIILAAERGHKDLVAMLLAKGARAEVKDWEGFTPRQVALRGGHKGVVEVLPEQ
jgi:ankyrin repeat protein